MMRAILPVLALLLAAAPPAPLRALTLEEAFRRVLADHPELRARSEEEAAAAAAVAAERAAGGPQAEASLELLARESRLGGDSAFLATRRQRLSVLVPLLDGGRSRARVEAARAEAEAARWRRIAAARALLAETAGAYAAFVRERRLLGLALSQERLLGEELAAARRRYRLGAGTAAEVAAAEARLATAAAERRRRVAELAASGARLRRLVGEEVAEAAGPDLPEDLPPDLDAALAVISDDPRLAAALARAAADRARARAEAAASAPELALVADMALAGGADARSDTLVDLAVGARLRVPLWDGGGSRARVTAARHRAAAAEASEEAGRRALAEELAALFAQLEAARARARELERARRAARLLLDAARREARAGNRAVVEVLDAVGELHDAEVALAENDHDLRVAAWRLAIATGALDHLLEEGPERSGPPPVPREGTPARTPASAAAPAPAPHPAPPPERAAAPQRPLRPAPLRGEATAIPARTSPGRLREAADGSGLRPPAPVRLRPPAPPPAGAGTPEAGERPVPAALADRSNATADAIEPAAGPPRGEGAVVLHGRLTEMP